ncbi:MAG: FGGY family carbohydrate kinase [Spirochaetia bacterium]|jgi:xylulokinase
MRDRFIGADLGTSGIKAGVTDVGGRVLASLYWETELTSSGPGRMAQSPEDFFAQTLRIIRAVMEKAGISGNEVQGIALDGQMGGVIGVDRSFVPLTGLDMGLDIRSEKYNALVHQQHGKLLRSLSCGSPRNTPKIMWWQGEQGPTYRKVVKFVTLGGFVAGRLAGLRGEDAFLDYTSLAFFGNEDARRRAWSDELSTAFGLDLEKFPRIVEPWEIVGTLTAAAARESGLLEGTPVAAGAGDQPAGLLGGGFLRPGALCDVSGSSTLLFQCVDYYRPDTAFGAVAYIPSILEDRYHALSYINGGGIALSWLRDGILKGSAFTSYEKLTRGAAALPAGADGLLFVPYFGGRQCPYDADFRGGWLGLNWGHRPEHLFRSMIEGLTYDCAVGLKNLRKLFPEYRPQELDSYGGGSRNGLWSQIKADVLGLPVRCLESHDFAITGCALVAARALGAITEFDASRRADAADCPVYRPDPATAEKYAGYLEAFEACCSGSGIALSAVFRCLSALAGGSSRATEALESR